MNLVTVAAAGRSRARLIEDLLPRMVVLPCRRPPPPNADSGSQ